eukprot:gene821-867_t
MKFQPVVALYFGSLPPQIAANAFKPFTVNWWGPGSDGTCADNSAESYDRWVSFDAENRCFDVSKFGRNYSYRFFCDENNRVDANFEQFDGFGCSAGIYSATQRNFPEIHLFLAGNCSTEPMRNHLMAPHRFVKFGDGDFANFQHVFEKHACSPDSQRSRSMPLWSWGAIVIVASFSLLCYVAILDRPCKRKEVVLPQVAFSGNVCGTEPSKEEFAVEHIGRVSRYSDAYFSGSAFWQQSMLAHSRCGIENINHWQKKNHGTREEICNVNEEKDSIMHAQLTPEKVLSFADGNKETTLTVKNTSDSTIGYKVKTTAPKSYLVKPSSGYLERGEVQTVKISLQGGHTPGSGHRFLVQTAKASDASQDVKAFWSNMQSNKDQIQETKLAVAEETGGMGGPPDTGGDINTKYDNLLKYSHSLEQQLKKHQAQAKAGGASGATSFQLWHVIVAMILAVVLAKALETVI